MQLNIKVRPITRPMMVTACDIWTGIGVQSEWGPSRRGDLHGKQSTSSNLLRGSVVETFPCFHAFGVAHSTFDKKTKIICSIS
jgi:hypothetical protein